MSWTNKKPILKKECLLLVATLIRNEWDYSAYWIKKEYFDGKWYWGLFTIEGEEWGDIDDLTADRYKVINVIPKPKK